MVRLKFRLSVGKRMAKPNPAGRAERCGDEKEQLSAPGGVPGAAALGWIGFRECDVPVVVAAKSFVLSRWPNFYFSRPPKLLRGQVYS
jgi:hypothetical protein